MNEIIIDSKGWVLGLLLAQFNVCNDLLDERRQVGTGLGILRASVLLFYQVLMNASIPVALFSESGFGVSKSSTLQSRVLLTVKLNTEYNCLDRS